MSHRLRQVIIGILIGIAVAGGAIAVARGTGDDDGGIDKRSYTLGYDEAFGGAYTPTDTRSRDAIKASCDSLFRSWVQASGKQNVVRSDWVEGCADVAQNKDSRFG